MERSSTTSMHVLKLNSVMCLACAYWLHDSIRCKSCIVGGGWGGWGVLVIYIYIYIYLIWLVWVALATLAHSYAGIVSFARRLNHGFQERGCICSFLHSWSFALTFVPRNRSLRALSALGSRNRSLRACVCTNTKYAKRLHDISSTFSCSVTETFNTDGASQ
jgi:hypothetical protein